MGMGFVMESLQNTAVDTHENRYKSNEKAGKLGQNRKILTMGVWDGKPIEWIVLKKENDMKLVISKEIIFNRRYHSSDTKINWSNCELRDYLNHDFFGVGKVFSDEEEKRIVNHLIDCGDTKDNVFLLGSEEVMELLSPNERQCDGNYMTRDVGYYQYSSQYVRVIDNEGRVYQSDSSSYRVNYAHGVRPAMWILDLDLTEK